MEGSILGLVEEVHWNFPGKPEENHAVSQSGQLVHRPMFESDTSRI